MTDFNVSSLNNLTYTATVSGLSYNAVPYVAGVSGVNDLGGGNFSVDGTEFQGSLYDGDSGTAAADVASVKLTYSAADQNLNGSKLTNIIEFTFTYGDGHTVSPFAGEVIAENTNMVLVDFLTGFTPGVSDGTLATNHYELFSNIDLSQTEMYDNGTTPAPGPALPLTFGPTADYTYGLQPTYQNQAPPCFAEGTRILTPHGEVAVEDLREGDSVCLASGGRLEVTWIGHRRIDCRSHSKAATVLPVRIAAGAFGDGGPHRPLLLSPEHSVYAMGVLIPVRLLINGTTIRQVPVDSVTYYHIELERHAILLSEGLPTESYLDTGNRNVFDNGGPGDALHHELTLLAWDVSGCAPLVVTGPVYRAVRDMLALRATQLNEINRYVRPSVLLARAA